VGRGEEGYVRNYTGQSRNLQSAIPQNAVKRKKRSANPVQLVEEILRVARKKGGIPRKREKEESRALTTERGKSFIGSWRKMPTPIPRWRTQLIFQTKGRKVGLGKW